MTDMTILAIGFLVGMVFVLVLTKLNKNQIIAVTFNDGSWFKGIRKAKYIPQESSGTHHFMVTDVSDGLKDLIGKRIAVPISSAKYFVIDDGKK